MSAAAGTPAPPADRPVLERQIGAVLFGRVLVAALDSLRTFLLARLLDKAGFGTLSIGLTWYGLCTALGVLALPDALMALLPRCEGGGRALVARALRLLVVTGLAGGAIVFGISLLTRGETAAVLRWAAVAVALDLPGQVLQGVLLGTRQHQRAALSGLLLSGAASVALLLPAALGLATPWLMAGFCGVALVRLGLLRSAWSQLGPAEHTPIVAHLWPMAWPLWLTSATGIANRSVSTAAASTLLPAPAFADLAVGSQELPVVTMLPNAVAVAVLPHLVRLGADNQPAGMDAALALWHGGIRRLALVMMPLWVVATLEAEPLLAVLYGGEAWRDAALPFRITALLLPLRVTTYGTMLLALGRPRQVLWSQVAGVVANLALVAVMALTPAAAVTWRVGWAAAAGTLGQAVAIGWMLAAIGAVTGRGLGSVFPWLGLLRALGLAVAAALPLPAVTAMWGESFGIEGLSGTALGLGVRVVLYATVYAGLLAGLGFVPAEDRQTLGRWLRLEPLWKKG